MLMYSRQRGSKYKSRKTTTSDGITFDSKKEAKRWGELNLLLAVGKIEGLERQVKFVLIPAQREPDKVGPKGGKIKGALIEREVAYIADFVYFENGERVVEDVKGYRDGQAYAVFTIKRKLMLYFHGIRVKEV